MPELKHFDPAIAVKAVETAAAGARAELEHATKRALSLLRDAQEGVQALENGVGPLLERAQHVYVATFTTSGFKHDQFICDPSLHFDSSQYRVALDDSRRHHGIPNELIPKLDCGRRYRAIVILEAVD